MGNDETMMHENEAAEVLYRMSACGTNSNETDVERHCEATESGVLVAPQVKCIHPL